MTAQLDINTLASWSAVLAGLVGMARFGRKASSWFERTDKRLLELEKRQATTEERVVGIDKQLRPNGGSSHHDVLRREIREVAGHRKRWYQRW